MKFPPHASCLALLSVLLLQASTFTSSGTSAICSALEKSLVPPILSVFHYPPAQCIVFLLKSNIIQYIPVSRFNVAEGTLSIRDTHPKPIIADPELNVKSNESPPNHYEHLDTIPSECNRSRYEKGLLKMHYQVKYVYKRKLSDVLVDLYLGLPEVGERQQLARVVTRQGKQDERSVYHPVIDFFCPTGHLCSLVTDQVECEGYRFMLTADPSDKKVVVQQLWHISELGTNQVENYSLQSVNGTHLKFTTTSSNHSQDDDLFSGELPLGFILHKTAVLFNLRTSEVFIFPYDRVTTLQTVPLVARSSLAQFFKCFEEKTGQDGLTENPHWASSFAFQLSALLALIVLLFTLISLCLLLLRAIRNRQPSYQRRRMVTTDAHLSKPDDDEPNERSTSVSRQSSNSHFERGRGRLGGGGRLKKLLPHTGGGYSRSRRGGHTSLRSIISSVTSSSTLEVGEKKRGKRKMVRRR